jgi:4-amino-4-deoxy-L-arabinose transferase-like glycosyltransferase
MFADPVIRYLPNAAKLLQCDLSFNDVPLFILIEAFWMLLFKGTTLWFFWKLTSFIFFVGILLLLPILFRRIDLEKKEHVIMLALFLFSTWSLLLSVVVLQDMMLTFFVLALFLSIENYLDKPSRKWLAISIFLSICMIFTKMTGYFILAGFFLYVLARSNIKIKERIRFILYLGIGSSVTLLWMVKNYINTGMFYIHSVMPGIQLHSFSEYTGHFIRFYHYFWEIPMPSKVGISGVNLSSIFLLFYKLYYIGALIITAILSILIIFSLFKYGKKYKEYLLLMVPLFAFAFYWAFIIFWGPHDFGRYTFPLWLFLFFFPVKLISSIKKQGIRYLCYALIILFCFVSIASAYGITIHMNNIDKQILKLSDELKRQDARGIFVTNDEFTSSALSFYLDKPIRFNSTGGTKNKAMECKGTKIFSTEDYDIFKEDSKYKICRY